MIAVVTNGFLSAESEQDRKALDKLFREVLGFEVTVLQDLNKAVFKKELSDIAEGINKSAFQYDRLFVAILGHGNQVSFFVM